MIRKAAFVAAALFCAGCASASTEPAGEPSAGEQAAMQDAWTKYATPGEAHAKLAKQCGEWEISSKMWMAPGAPPMESRGHATLRMVLGGRYQAQEFHGDFGGMPYEAMGTTGYDNQRRAYLGTWIDNMGTGLMTMEGAETAPGVFTYTGEMVDPAGGGMERFRSVMTEQGPDTILFEMFGTEHGSAGMRKMMEMVYTRQR